MRKNLKLGQNPKPEEYIEKQSAENLDGKQIM